MDGIGFLAINDWKFVCYAALIPGVSLYTPSIVLVHNGLQRYGVAGSMVQRYEENPDCASFFLCI